MSASAISSEGLDTYAEGLDTYASETGKSTSE